METAKQKLRLIDQLEQVAWTSKLYEKWLSESTHKVDIRTKCLAYWKRRFNRILNELKY